MSARAYDSDNQLSDTTTTNGITIDVTLPTISQISAGNGVNQFLNSNDLFHGSWQVEDNLSGIAFNEVSLGTQIAIDDVVSWQNVDMEDSVLFENLSLTNGTEYFLNVRTHDFAGNVFAASDSGVIIDLEPPMTGSVFDAINGDLLFSNSSSVISSSWSGFSDNISGIQYFEYAIGTAPGSANTSNWLNVGLSTNAITENLSLGKWN